MMISGIQKISVYNPATGVVVQLNKIASGGDFNLKEPLESKNVDGQIIYDGHKSFMEFAAYDNTGFDQLETWMKAKTPVRIVAAGFEQNLLWYESSPITVKKNYLSKTGSLNFFTVRIAKEKGEHNIFLLSNLLRSNGKWADADTNGYADLFTKVTPLSHTFVASIQKLYGEITDSGYLYGSIVFPIAGIDVYGRLNKTAQVGNDAYIYTKSFNYASGILAQSSGESNNHITLANTYRVAFEVALSVTSGANYISFGLPYLGLKRSAYVGIDF